MATACTDLGDPAPSPTPGGLAITDLVPRRTVVGDTMRVVGSGFGSDPAGSAVLFPSEAQDVEATILSWSATEIAVLVPAEADSAGAVRVLVDGTESNGFSFSVASRIVTYSVDVMNLFDAHGCVICHKSPLFEGLLHVTPHADLLNRTPPVVIPRRSGASHLIQTLQPSTPVSSRMPDEGSGYDYLIPSEILVISDWIDQGARDN